MQNHLYQFSPALQPINILLLLLPALLGRLLIANLSAYFLQNPFFVLIDKREGHFHFELPWDEMCELVVVFIVLVLMAIYLCKR